MRRVSETEKSAHLEALAILARGIAQTGKDGARGPCDPARFRNRTFLLITIP